MECHPLCVTILHVDVHISGVPWWSTDVGGFGCPVSPYNNTDPYMQELIVRWYQFGECIPSRVRCRLAPRCVLITLSVTLDPWRSIWLQGHFRSNVIDNLRTHPWARRLKHPPVQRWRCSGCGFHPARQVSCRSIVCSV